MSTTEHASELMRLLRTLRAVRQFRAEPIPQDVLDAVLNVARWSGSAGNRQPWDLVVVRERSTLQSLANLEGFAHHLAGAAAGIILVMGGQAGQEAQETFDEGRLSERIMLAAHAYAVGSSIGWFVGEGQRSAKSILGIPQRRLVRTAISMGYADEEARIRRPKPAQARKPLNEIVHWERF